jgi:glycerol-3-phosphate acyltransferase PlsX
MGGDHGPSVVVPAAIEATRRLGDRARVFLLGDEAAIRAELTGTAYEEVAERIELVHAPENIEMGEAPSSAIRRKKNSPIVVGAELMREERVDAFVSAGSTGAVTAAGTLVVGRIPGVARPAIATMLPTERGASLLLDVGANSDCKPIHLLQFGTMGRIYAETVLGREKATVGLLNIGEEPKKGNELSQLAHQLLLKHESRFIGNLEGRDVFAGKADVIVADGFVGNVVLKLLESFGGFLLRSFREEVGRDWRALLGGMLLKPKIRDFSRRFNYAEYGGAPLLGCRGLIIIAHGGSNEVAITNAIAVAERAARDQVCERIATAIEKEKVE